MRNRSYRDACAPCANRNFSKLLLQRRSNAYLVRCEANNTWRPCHAYERINNRKMEFYDALCELHNTHYTRNHSHFLKRNTNLFKYIYIYIYNENIFFEFSKSKFPRFFCYRNWSTEIHAARERKFYLSFLI